MVYILLETSWLQQKLGLEENFDYILKTYFCFVFVDYLFCNFSFFVIFYRNFFHNARPLKILIYMKKFQIVIFLFLFFKLNFF